MRTLRRTAILLLALWPACKKEAPPAPPDAAYVPGSIDDKERADSVRPVYPTANVTPEPLAERLCEALHGLPRKRHAECCNRGTGVVLTGECVRNLSGAMATKAVALEESAVAACEAAMTAQHQGCDWVGPWPMRLPDACARVITGTLDSGAKCRSSLECKDGLRCLGVGPTDVGTCAPPPGPGRLCGTAVDTLAVYTRQDRYEEVHPPCAGYCEKNRCYAYQAVGADCTTNAQCGPDARCAGGKCTAGATAKVGSKCIGGECGVGLRCALGQCLVPRPIGAACHADQECAAGCEIPPGAKSGKCAMRCDPFPRVRMSTAPRSSTVAP